MEQLGSGRGDRGECTDPGILPGGCASEAGGTKRRQAASMRMNPSVLSVVVSAFRPTALAGP